MVAKKNGPVEWNSKYLTPEQYANFIEESRVDKGDDKIHLALDPSMNFVILLHSILRFPKEIQEDEAMGICSRAVFSSAKKGKVTADSLLEEINQEAISYLKKAVILYKLFTSISVERPPKAINFRLGNHSITILSKTPKRMIKESVTLRKDAEKNLYAESAKNYSYVSVTTKGRSQSEAAFAALDKLDLARGILNLGFNKNYTWRLSIGSKNAPINSIILGPVHTLHFMNGKIAADSSWWFEENYLGAIKLIDLKKEEGVIFKYYKNFMQKLRISHYRAKIEEAVRRYVRALDERNWFSGFAKLWGVLELLTDSTNQSNDVTIARAAFIYRNVEFARQELEYLRTYRNRYIHLDAGNHQIEKYLFSLKRNVETMIYFHIGFGLKFKSFKQTISFLDLPKSSEELNARRRLINSAIEFFNAPIGK